jgi:alpha-beta hydrolase superfamily lysophospholipase
MSNKNLARTATVAAAGLLSLVVVALVAALVFGGPARPRPMQSIGDAFRGVDFSALPPSGRYQARDGAQLAYRRYAAAGGQASRGSVVLVHGSSANSQSMHPLAQSFAQAGFTVYSLDMRGHGDSGPRGDIAYVGQLEDDLQDFMLAVRPGSPKTLVGFSAGGGFAIRVAGGTSQALFDNYLFMAPYTSRHAATYRPDAGGWVALGVPRLVALSLLNQIGVSRFNHLPVVAFAINDAPQAALTPRYAYALLANFQPHEDWQGDIRGIRAPSAVLDGEEDEVFVAAKYARVFAEAGRPDIPVTLVPATNHISLTLAAPARTAAVDAVARLDAASSPSVSLPTTTATHPANLRSLP